MNPDLFPIPGPWRGRLAIVTRPRGGDWLEDEAGGWRRAGLAAGSNRIRFVSFPMPDRGVPAFNLGRARLDVAVHCRQGIGRSGLIAAGVLVTSGVPAGKALEVVSSARGQIVPETPAQVAWVRQLPADRLVEAI